jgi:protein phosphatase methylesterase 1
MLMYPLFYYRSTKRTPNPAYAPISASSFFSQAVEVDVPSSGLIFRAYYTPPKKPNGTVMVFHHGAGYSALSFARLAKEVEQMGGGEVGVVAIDARRHGMS